jgi:hypothetical protein
VRTAEGQSVLLSLYYNTPGTGARRRGPPQIQVGPTTVLPRQRDNFKTEPEPTDPELFEQQQGPDTSLDSTERLFDR